MHIYPFVKKSIIGLASIAVAVGAFYGLSILDRTIYLEIHAAVYIAVILAVGGLLALRFHSKRGRMTAGEYAGESLAAAGFIILACFLVIPESVAALNYYLPGGGEPYQWECTVTDKQVSYTRGAPYHYVTFTSSEGGDSFRLKVSSRDYRQMHTGCGYNLTVREGALSYLILEGISR